MMLALKLLADRVLGFLKSLPWQVWLGLAIALGLLLGLRWHNNAVEDAFTSGQSTERAAWETAKAKSQAEADLRQRIADQNLAKAEAIERAEIARNRQEIDNALAKIPDQALTARQLSRACIELRRQGKSTPACQPQPTAEPAIAH